MAGKTVLVLEDEALIAMDIETTLSAAGYQVIVAPVLEDAMHHAQNGDLGFGILDYIVDHNRSSDGVAQVLAARGIPFGICSGAEPASEFSGTPFLPKPFTEQQLLAFVGTHIPAAALDIVEAGGQGGLRKLSTR